MQLSEHIALIWNDLIVFFQYLSILFFFVIDFLYLYKQNNERGKFIRQKKKRWIFVEQLKKYFVTIVHLQYFEWHTQFRLLSAVGPPLK